MKKYIVGLVLSMALGFVSFLTSNTFAQYTGMAWKDVFFAHHNVGNTSYANAGDTVLYTLGYTNNSTGPVTVVMSDIIPSNLTYIPIFPLSLSIHGSPGAPCAGAFSTTGNILTYTNCVVQSGQSFWVDILTMVNPNAVPYTRIINTGTVNVYNVGNLITPIATHITSATIFPYPLISINKILTGNPPQILTNGVSTGVIVQSAVTYQITLTNSGSVAATGMVFSDTLPYGFILNSIVPVSGTPVLGPSTYIVPTNTHMWTGLTIPANTTYTYNVSISLNNVLALPGQQFTNTGTIATGFVLTGGFITTGVSAVTSTILGVPSLSMSKTITSPNASGLVNMSGDLVTYQLSIVNTGTATATGVVVDTLPSQLTYVSSSLTPTSVVGQTITWSSFAIPAGQTGIINITARVNNNYVANTTYTNNANFTCQSPVICNNTSASIAGRILGFGAIGMSKTITSPNASGAVSQSGNTVTYNLTITNTGTAIISGLLTDTLPLQLTYVSSSLTPASVVGQTITWSNFILTAGQTRTITITTRLNNNYAAGTIYTNTGDFMCQSSVPCNNATASVNGIVIGFGSLSMSKTITSPNASGLVNMSGDLVTYQLSIVNTGTATATGVVVDTLPSQLTYVSSSLTPTSVVGQTITWSSFAIPAGQTGIINITARVNNNYVANTTYTNNANFTCQSPVICNNTSASVTGTILGFGSVTLTKSIISPVSGNVSRSGDSVTYQITLLNSGTATITGDITDIRPSQLTYLSSNPAASVTGANPAWSGFSVPAGQTRTIMITGVVNNTYTGGTQYVNDANFVCTLPSVCTVVDNATVTGTIVGFGAPSIVKDISLPNASGAIYTSGTFVTYAINVYNTGTATMTGTFVDTLPPQLSFVSIGVPATVSGQVITISGLSIPAGQFYPMLVTAVLNGNYPANTVYTNTATYTCTSPSVCSNAIDTATGIILGFGAVNMTKSIITPNASGHVSQSGDMVTYQIVITNTGTSTVTGFLTDIRPSQLTYISSNPSVASGATGLIVTIPAGGSFIGTITGVLNNNYPAGTLYVNTANFACISPSVCNNATATVTGNVLGFGSVLLNKEFFSPNMNGELYSSGDIVSYVITVTNTGTSSIIGTLIDMRPSHITYLTSAFLSGSITPSFSGSIITRTGLYIDPLVGSVKIILTGVLNNNYSGGTLYVNNSDFICTNPSLCSVVDDGTVTGTILGLPNLVLQKNVLTGSNATLSGDIISYSLNLTNSGTATWSGDRCIMDVWPSQVTFFSFSPAQLTGSVGSCPPGAWYGTGVPATIILTGILNSNYPVATIITNTGTVSTIVRELYTGDNVSYASFAIGGIAEMALTKTMTGAVNGISGSIVTYTLSYVNNGTTGAANVVVSDTLPGIFTYSGTVSGGTGVVSGNLITWNIGTVPIGGSGNIVFQAYYNQFVTSGTIINTGLVTTTTRDIDRSTDYALHTFSIVPIPEIEIIKTILDPGQPLLGSPMSFMLTVVNHGGATGENIIIQDILPSFITYSSHTSNLNPLFYTGPLNVYTGTNTPLRTDLFVLGPGQSGYLIITGYLNYQPLTGISYINTGVATGVLSASGVGLIDTNRSNNVSTVTGTLIPQIGCSLAITGSAPWQTSYGLDLSGQTVSFNYALILSGNVPLSGGVLTTTRPADLTRPLNLPLTNIVASGIVLSGNTLLWTLTGTTINRSFNSLGLSGIVQFTISGATFTCNATTSLPAPVACNNGYLNQGEQCDVGSFNNQTYTTILPGLNFDASTQMCDNTCHIVTTSVNNCATMYASGLSQTSCANTSSNNPVLTLDKSVTPSTNLAVGSSLVYTVVIANTSNQTAYNVQLSDIFPRSYLNYVGPITATPNLYNGLISVSPSGQSFAGNLSTIAPGQSVTLSFPATISSVPPTNIITNTVNVSYTNASNTPMSPLSDSVSVSLGASQGLCNGTIVTTNYPYLQNGQATVRVRVDNPLTGNASLAINCGNGSSFSTIGTNLYATCTYTTVGTQPTIQMTVNGNTSPSCTVPVTVRQNTVNRCGDGYVGVLEQCDMGNGSTNYNGGTIGDYLDNIGRSLSSYQYRGSMCSSSCTIQGSTVTPPACWYSDTVISVMEGEYLPFGRDLEVSDNSIVDSCNGARDGSILKSSMRCDFKIFNKDEEATGNETERKNIPCAQMFLSKNEWNGLFDGLEPPFVTDPFGTQIFSIDKDLVNGGYGEYKLSLDKVSYAYCRNGVAVTGNPYMRVCQVNFAVTKPYMMVKTPVTQRPSDTLDDYYVLGSDTQTIIGSSEFDRYNNVTSLSNLSKLTSSMNTMINALIIKYEKLAKTVSNSSITAGKVKKVPGQSFYIIEGDSVFEPGDDYTVPTTIVVKGNLTIVGDVPVNMLLVATGKVTINAADKDCDTQTIRGIIVAKGGFTRSSSSTRWNTLNSQGNPKNDKRCSRGNVHVLGVLYGPNVDNLVESRRSHLEHWFTTMPGVNTDAEIKAERRNEIYQGASVYVEQNASLWRSMPPGADEFLKALQVSRY